MKTPKEILLARHKAVEPKLDEIRRAAVAGLTPQSAREADVSFVLKVWRELIWPCRRTWVGLAAAWLVVGWFNLSHSDQAQVAVAKSSPPAEETRLVLLERRRVLDELIGSVQFQSPVAEPPRRSNNQPRSELRAVAMA